MANDRHLLALGDCNTCGTPETEGASYPWPLGRELGVRVVNCGHTMCTLREGWEYARRRLSADTAYLTVQFGLVDSWLTFRGAPYVLNYPDNPARRVLRKVVKKFKKTGRRLGFHKMFGEAHVVSPGEYRATLEAIIQLARGRSPGIRIALLDTAPSLIEDRNPGILKFNRILGEVARDRGCVSLDCYTPFVGKPGMYLDHVHLNQEAHALIARMCAEAFRAVQDPR